MNSHNERRRAFRVDNPVVLDYRVLSDSEMRKGMRDMRRGDFAPYGLSAVLLGMETEVQAAIARLKQKSEETANAVDMLNHKINALINVLPLLEEHEDGLLSRPRRDANVSASGLSFVNEEPLQAGTNLYLRLVLAPSYTYLQGYARVVRCTERDDSAYPFTVAVEFVLIADQHRELLVRFTMRRQTELLRARRIAQ